MATQLDVTTRNSMGDALAARVDSGTGAIIEVRTGAPPANNAAPDSGTLLGTCLMSATAFAAAVNGVIQENAITADGSADASGTPGHYRVKTQAGGAVIIQGSAGVGAGDLNYDNPASLGGPMSITDFAFTMPGA